jgi:hypothetical protein
MDTNTPETAFANRLGIAQKALRTWRKDGSLTRPEHWDKSGTEILLTPAGMEKVRGLIGLSAEVIEAPKIGVSIRVGRLQGKNPRLLRGFIHPEGGRCSVRIIAPRVFTVMFPIGAIIQCEPTETEGIYTFEGKAPKRIRI